MLPIIQLGEISGDFCIPKNPWYWTGSSIMTFLPDDVRCRVEEMLSSGRFDYEHLDCWPKGPTSVRMCLVQPGLIAEFGDVLKFLRQKGFFRVDGLHLPFAYEAISGCGGIGKEERVYDPGAVWVSGSRNILCLRNVGGRLVFGYSMWIGNCGPKDWLLVKEPEA